MAWAYAPSPYSNPVNAPHPAPAPPNVAPVWNHPPERATQMTSMSPHNVAYQPHYGHAFPNAGMPPPNNVTGRGRSLSQNIPTTQAPSSGGVPAYDFQLAPNQHGALQRRPAQHGPAHYGQVQQGQVQHGQTQRELSQHSELARQRYEERCRAQHGTGEHRPDIHGQNQPAVSTPSVNTTPAPSFPARGTGHHDIEAITADFLKTVDPRSAAFGPGDIVDMVYVQWVVDQAQNGQATVQVRTKSTDTQELGAGNLTLMNHSTQVQRASLEQAAQPGLPVLAPHLLRSLPPPNSPRRNSAITLTSCMRGFPKVQTHRTRSMT